MTILLDAGVCYPCTDYGNPLPTEQQGEPKIGPVLLINRSLEQPSDITPEMVLDQTLEYFALKAKLGMGRHEILAMFVPSFLVPAYNVVLYPDHPAFSSVVKLASVEPFDFHPYLFGEKRPSV